MKKIPQTKIIRSNILNPKWKKHTLIVAEGDQAGRIIIDQITMKQAKELQTMIKERGLP